MARLLDQQQANIETGRFRPVSWYRIVTVGCLLTISGLLFIDYRPAIAVFAVYLLLIIVTPFSLRLGFFLPIVCRSKTAENQVSLTFDDGPEPDLTEPLLVLLKKYEIKATFFLIGEKIENHRETVRKIVSDGHEVGNHSFHHDNFLMLKPKARIDQEISDCQTSLERLGVCSYAFRPPVGITNPKLFRILLDLGMYCVGFSCRPVDFGNRRIRNLSRKVLKTVIPGDIILLHDKSPNESFSPRQWLAEIERIIIGLQKKNLKSVPLSELIGRPVMSPMPKHGPKAIAPFEKVLHYLSDYDTMVFKRPAELSEILSRRIRGQSRTDNFSSLEIAGLTSPGLGSVSSPVNTNPPSQTAGFIKPTLETAPTENRQITSLASFKAQTTSEYDSIFSFSGMFLEKKPDDTIAHVFNRLKPNGVFYLILPSNTFLGWLFLLNLGLKTGLKGYAQSGRAVIQSLKSTGFIEIQTVFSTGRIVKPGLTEIRAIKPL